MEERGLRWVELSDLGRQGKADLGTTTGCGGCCVCDHRHSPLSVTVTILSSRTHLQRSNEF